MTEFHNKELGKIVSEYDEIKGPKDRVLPFTSWLLLGCSVPSMLWSAFDLSQYFGNPNAIYVAAFSGTALLGISVIIVFLKNKCPVRARMVRGNW